MATVLKIYKTKITPQRNARVDSLDTYLESCGATYVDNNFQFIKPQIDMAINIDLSSTAFCTDPYRGTASLLPVLGNYLSLKLDPGSGNELTNVVYYYFILEARWISDESVSLKCSLDTINTFFGRLSWSDKTSIQREHVNRFKYTWLSDLSAAKNLGFVVDKVSEGVAPSQFYKTSNTYLTQPNTPNLSMDWYLMYKTNNSAISNGASSETLPSSNGLSCYLLPDDSYTVKQTGTSSSFTLNLNNYSVQNRHYYITGDAGGRITWSLTSTSSGYGTCDVTYNGIATNWNIGNVAVVLGDTYVTGGRTFTCVAGGYMRVNYYSKDYIFPIGIYQDSTDSKYYNGFFYNGTRVFFYRHITGSGIEYYSDSSFDPTRVYQFSATKVDDIFSNGGVIGLYRGLNFWVDMGSSGTNQISGNESVLKIRQNSNDEEVSAYTDIDSLPLAYDNGSSSVTSTVKGYKDLSEADLADSKLVKIIELPYCPSDITYQNGAYILNSSFVYNGLAKSLKYSDLRQRFKATLSDVTISELGVNIPASTVVSRAITAKNKSYESKLLNSDFYIYKLVYDGVYKQLKFENFDLSAYNSIPTMTVTFVPTNTIGSDISFAYSFNSATYSDETDFPVLISNRDNSLPIYNNDYINYMRYTYASDRANLDASARQSAITNGWSIAGAVAGTAASGMLVKAMLGATVGSGAGVAGAVIGATIGAATSIAAAINAKLQADVNIENSNRTLNAKVDVLRNQPVTVQGASSSIDIMKEYSNNKLRVIKYEPSTLFKDAMYDKLFYCGYAHPVQEVPNFTSRYWFNYVQCTPEFTGDTNAYSKYLDDIKARFEIGVTDYHYHKLLGGYDWDQTKENWETNLLSGIDAWDGRTTISGFLRGENEVVVGYVTSSQPSSLFDWYYMVGTQDPVSFSFSSETSATIEFASYPGPVIIIAKNKGDTTIQSPFEIDWE